MLAKSSDAVLKAGIPRVDLEFSKRYGKSTHRCFEGACPLTTSQALEFGEIQEMADKAGLFKSVNHVYGNQTYVYG